MNPWLKFVFILSLTVNVVIIAEMLLDPILIGFGGEEEQEFLEQTGGTWWLSDDGEMKLLQYLAENEPEIIDKLYQIRENRHKLSEIFTREEFDRPQSEVLLKNMREELFATQEIIQASFINYMETLSLEERKEVIPFFINHSFPYNDHYKDDHYEDDHKYTRHKKYKKHKYYSQDYPHKKPRPDK
ncbi:hypothetical protein COTS27_01583 [Spirochaetota bacterium]|nr:hypothetical protein COTS27_01583 [Spirochaetota bacterium]